MHKRIPTYRRSRHRRFCHRLQLDLVAVKDEVIRMFIITIKEKSIPLFQPASLAHMSNNLNQDCPLLHGHGPVCKVEMRPRHYSLLESFRRRVDTKMVLEQEKRLLFCKYKTTRLYSLRNGLCTVQKHRSESKR